MGFVPRTILIMVMFFVVCCRYKSAPNSEIYAETDFKKFENLRGNLKPIPEYMPTTSVVISSYYENFNIDLVQKLGASGAKTLHIIRTKHDDANSAFINQLIGQARKIGLDQRIKISPIDLQYSDDLDETVGGWTRDFGPLMFRRKDSGKMIVVNFRYYKNRPTENSFNQLFAKENKLELIDVPIGFEGGNFLAAELKDRMFCMTTTSVFSKNRDTPKEQVVDFFKSILGCDEFLVFPPMPYEGTQHIDLWAKAVKKDVIFVAELGFNTLGLTGERRKALTIKNYLDNQANVLKKYGFTVVRIPMPAPIFFENYPDMGKSLIRSYVNALIVNKWVLVPRYLAPIKILAEYGVHYYPDSCLIDRFENVVWSKFFEVGLTPVWINMDHLCPLGGSVHCATMQIPTAQ